MKEKKLFSKHSKNDISFRLIFSPTYLERLTSITDFLYLSSEFNIKFVEHFIGNHERVLAFLSYNPNLPPVHSKTGDQTWIFSRGRYRLFYQFDGESIHLLDLFDNRMSNIRIYPQNSFPSLDETE